MLEKHTLNLLEELALWKQRIANNDFQYPHIDYYPVEEGDTIQTKIQGLGEISFRGLSKISDRDEGVRGLSQMFRDSNFECTARTKPQTHSTYFCAYSFKDLSLRLSQQ
jgi:hypothetical protein